MTLKEFTKYCGYNFSNKDLDIIRLIDKGYQLKLVKSRKGEKLYLIKPEKP